MKKQFFKKLSFVLALAMIISVIAPAAGAFAADALKLTSTKKYLFVGEEDRDEYNFNINGTKGKGWKYSWESLNEDVAVVDESNGVTTAVGVGTTKVQVTITDKNGEEVDTLTATVIVKDNIKEVTISNDIETVKVGEVVDFNRTYKTFGGKTKGTTSVTRWFVTPAEGAKFENKDSDKFVAEKAGEYTVTAVSFQSQAKYDAWFEEGKQDLESPLVLATDSVTFTAVAEIAEVKQVDLDTFTVKFSSPIEDASKLSVSRLVGNTPVLQNSYVKKIEANATKDVFTVDFWVPFTQEATYVVNFPEMEAKSFVAAKVAADQVASMKIDLTEAVVTTAVNVPEKVKLFNANGVDITTDGLKAYITYTSSSVKAYMSPAGVLTMYYADDVTSVKAVYHTYKYDTNGQEVGTVSAEAVVRCVNAASVIMTGVKAWTIDASGQTTPNFGDVNTKLYVGETSRRLFAEIQKSNDTTVATDDDIKFTFTSSDESYLIIDSVGNMYPVKPGAVVVVVNYDGTPVGIINVVISAAKTLNRIDLGTFGFSLSNGDVENTKTLTPKLYDQYNNEITSGYTLTLEKISPQSVDAGFATENDTNVVFNAKAGGAVTVGNYTYKVTANYNGASASAFVSVTVVAPDGAPVKYQIKLGSTSVDLKVKNGDATPVEGTPKTLSVSLYGYDKNGLAVEVVTLDTDPTPTAAGDYRIAIDGPGTDIDATSGTFTLVTATSGSAVSKVGTGTYTVTAYKTVAAGAGFADIVIDQTIFTVTDSQPAPVFAETKTLAFNGNASSTTSTDPTLITVAKECFKITLDGNDVTANIIGVNAIGTTTSMFVQSVVVREMVNGAHIDHTVTIGLNIHKN